MRGVLKPKWILLFFFNDTATTEIYTLSLHDALPISRIGIACVDDHGTDGARCLNQIDRKSTRLNSSHLVISYAVFCLKKKKYRRCQPTRNKRGNPRQQFRSARSTPCRTCRSLGRTRS